MKMKIMEMQKNGNNQRVDQSTISTYKNEKKAKYNIFSNTYCYLIRSG